MFFKALFAVALYSFSVNAGLTPPPNNGPFKPNSELLTQYAQSINQLKVPPSSKVIKYTFETVSNDPLNPQAIQKETFTLSKPPVPPGAQDVVNPIYTVWTAKDGKQQFQAVAKK